MKFNINRRGFLKVTGAAAATTAVAPTALAEVAPTVLANVGEYIRSFDYVECVEIGGRYGVQYYNKNSERFKTFHEDRSGNWRLTSLNREQMANNLGEHVVEFFDADPENYILSSSPGNPLAFVVRSSEFPTSNLTIDKMTFKENHKVWGLS